MDKLYDKCLSLNGDEFLVATRGALSFTLEYDGEYVVFKEWNTYRYFEVKYVYVEYLINKVKFVEWFTDGRYFVGDHNLAGGIPAKFRKNYELINFLSTFRTMKYSSDKYDKFVK